MAFTPNQISSFLGLRPTGDLGPNTWYTKRRGTIVFFPRSPPKQPPTDRQIRQRQNFTLAAAAWQSLTPATRAAWELATKRLSLSLNGYNLWTWYFHSRDDRAIATIARQSSLDLFPKLPTE